MISIHPPYVFKDAISEIKKTLKRNNVSSYGETLLNFEKHIQNYTKSKFVKCCSSGTAALHIALKIAGIKKGEEILVPSITFIATVNAINYVGAKPIFFGCDKYLNINTNDVKEFLNKKTYLKNGFTYNKDTKKKISGIIPVHIFGNAVNLEEIISICKKKKIKIIEDATEALGTKIKIKGKYYHAGTIGDVGCLSFNGNKIITTGHGGALMLKNKKDLKKASYLISQATNDSEKYIHDEVGFNYRFSSLNSAFGISQIKKIKYILDKKKVINNFYKKEFNKTSQLSILDSPNYAKNNYWLNLLKFDPKKEKAITNLFKLNNIQIKKVWYPNHLQKPYKNFQKYKIKNLAKYCRGFICLPSGINLHHSQMKKIINVILKNEK